MVVIVTGVHQPTSIARSVMAYVVAEAISMIVTQGH